MSASTLIGLEQPPLIAPTPTKPAVSAVTAPPNLIGNKTSENKEQLNDLIQLYQEAAFSAPILTAARFNYQASKELYWQGFSLLMPQANATPGGTRYYQHGTGSTVVSNNSGNSRVFDQKSYTVTLAQPVFNIAALELFKQGDLSTKLADMRFFSAQQDLILRVSQAYFEYH
ncbi:TolC family protein [Polynucleobacter necessarius]|uniref:TolC family protein n=1 Tax=Polynucleobacter necessarius TaxID=576610 RepID=UPI001E34C64C|nr:TolC family protein [Polynucleobacter necessarius]